MAPSLTTTLARYLQNHWRTTPEIAERLYAQPLSEKKLRAARQALSRLRSAVESGHWPTEVPAGKSLVLDERWEKKSDGHGSEKCFRLRLLDVRRDGGIADRSGGPYLQMWFPPTSWAGWIVEGFKTLHRDRYINHKHLYTEVRGPENWLTVASAPIYQDAVRTAGRAMYEELYAPTGNEWAGAGDLVYLGLGTGNGLADCRVIRELLEENRARCVRAVPMDFSQVLLSETVANLYQEFSEEIAIGRLILNPILGDLECPEDWAGHMPAIENGASLVVGIFGNTLGHLQHRERQTLSRIFDCLDRWAEENRCPRWSLRNSRVLLGISLQRKEGAPHGRGDREQARHWLNLISDPLMTLLETREGEYRLQVLDVSAWEREQGRTAVARLLRRADEGERVPVGRICHEELPYKPNDGITGVVQRYVFAFDRDLEVEAQKVFARYHLPEARWGDLEGLTARFEANVDQVVLIEVTQFNLNSFRPALRRMGVANSDRQVHLMKVGNAQPYAVLTFART